MSLDEQITVLNGIGIILAFTLGLTTAKIMWQYNKIMAIIGVIPNFLFVAQALYYIAYQETLNKQQRQLFLFATFLTIPIWIAGAYYAFVSGANLGNVLAIRLMIIIVYLLVILFSICVFDFERIKYLFSKVIHSDNFYAILGFLLIGIIHSGSNMDKVDKFLAEVNIKYREPKSEIDKFLADKANSNSQPIPEYAARAQKDIQRIKENLLSLTDGTIVPQPNQPFYPDNYTNELESKENWWLADDKKTIYLHIVNNTPNPINGIGVNLSKDNCENTNKSNKPYYVRISPKFLLPNSETVVKFSGFDTNNIYNPNGKSCLIVFKSW